MKRRSTISLRPWRRPIAAGRTTAVTCFVALLASLHAGDGAASTPAALAAPTPPAQESEQPAFDAALARYEAWKRRASLWKRTMGRIALAQTGDPRALPLLIEDYRRPEEPKQQVKALIASLAADHLTAPELLPRHAEWRAAARKPEDSWLWLRTLELDARHGELATVEAAVAAAPTFVHRLAALHALAPAKAAAPELLPKIPTLLALKTTSPVEAGALAQTVAAVLLRLKPFRGDEPFVAACSAVIDQLDDKTLPLPSKRVVARHLAQLFDKTGVADVAAEPWRRELAARAWETPRATTAPTYAASFAGIPTTGVRLCYVIDCSDSMLKPVAGRAKEKAAETGPTRRDDAASLPAINWDRVKTRFDLARELVIASIRQLGEERRFAIVLFGTDVELFAATRGLVPAKKGAIARVEKELRAMTAGPPTADRPDGTLMGDTNLQGGLDRAFRVTSKGLDAKALPSDLELIEEGVDAIFLFSDGDPSSDDFVVTETRDPEDQLGDPETGAAHTPTPLMEQYGPYVLDQHLLDEVRRWNLFRGAEIHCVGTGEVSLGLLRDLAALGLGQVKQIGKDQ